MILDHKTKKRTTKSKLHSVLWFFASGSVQLTSTIFSSQIAFTFGKSLSWQAEWTYQWKPHSNKLRSPASWAFQMDQLGNDRMDLQHETSLSCHLFEKGPVSRTWSRGKSHWALCRTRDPRECGRSVWIEGAECGKLSPRTRSGWSTRSGSDGASAELSPLEYCWERLEVRTHWKEEGVRKTGSLVSFQATWFQTSWKATLSLSLSLSQAHTTK